MFLFQLGQRVADQDIVVFVADHQRRLLAKTCFRPTQEPKAGSFARWATIEQLFHDQRVRSLFSEHVAQAVALQQKTLMNSANRAHEAFTIDVGRAIGWSATASIDDFTPAELELRTFNKRYTAMSVRSRSEQKAPLTSKISFLCQLRLEHTDRYGTEWKVIILCLAVGPHICDTQGNVAGSSELAFFPWSHPGEPLRR